MRPSDFALGILLASIVLGAFFLASLGRLALLVLSP
jgi:hypothetical protein